MALDRTTSFTVLHFSPKAVGAMCGSILHMAPPPRRLFVIPMLLLLLAGGCSTDYRSRPDTPMKTKFRVLQTPSEDMSTTEEKHILEGINEIESTSRHLKAVQLVFTDVGRVWLFRSGSELCLSRAPLGAVACAQSRVARKRGLVIGTFTPPVGNHKDLRNFVVVGVVPNGVKQVTAHIGAEQVRQVQVHQNVFALRSNQPIQVELT